MNTQTCLSDADLGRLSEGAVSPKQRAAFERHIDVCPRCRARWSRVAAGSRHIEAVLRGEGATRARSECPSVEALARYVADRLEPAERQMLEDHLATCPACRRQILAAAQVVDTYAHEGDAWWSRYVGQQMLHLAAVVPDMLDDVLTIVGARPVPTITSAAIIKLPVLEPSETASLRLAAATGEDIAEETLRQDDPPFEFHVTQFGEQVRITARALDAASLHRDCLCRLRFFEGGDCRLSRILLVEDGQGRCVLEPEETTALRPEEGHLRIQLEPLLTLEQLAAAGAEAYVPILKRLLDHDDAPIRRHAVEVLARLLGPEARSLVEPLQRDPDEAVREAVANALKPNGPADA